jgi:hypothetical protein
MTLTDYAIDLLLIAVVFRQMRPRELTPRSVLLPVGLVGFACLHYLRPISLRGHDVVLVGVLAAVGVVLGVLSGLATDVWQDTAGRIVAQAGVVAAAVWVAGMGFRLAFAVWSTGSGASDVARFSVSHGITDGQVWTNALVLMAVGEVLARAAALQLRRVRVRTRPLSSPARELSART